MGREKSAWLQNIVLLLSRFAAAVASKHTTDHLKPNKPSLFFWAPCAGDREQRARPASPAEAVEAAAAAVAAAAASTLAPEATEAEDAYSPGVSLESAALSRKRKMITRVSGHIFSKKKHYGLK